ncbi:MAG: helix-turn-helix domain-containing protein [Bacteroidales bacterium]|jgi:excisionase family DNA binding protein|nr:helix-turn-helix domain-containing protein [Bacteroidales bacterium]MDX9926974.1 helix-turn-helix domain-containing protein [Bacteroidales bacterium]HNX84998.1 helix-turn-helix domain-containing protein [Bacteroidales bacterium]HPS97405.1 helix-turn-helix domain-containing protein [Bacteroidales bacterium]
MKTIDSRKPTTQEQLAAKESYESLVSSIGLLQNNLAEIEISETGKRIRIPVSVLKLLVQILKEISQGNPVTVVPEATEITTQAASEVLGCSRPHVVRLLEEGKIPYSKVGKHRRIRYDDLMSFKKKMKVSQKKKLQDLMKLDEESGLYDT